MPPRSVEIPNGASRSVKILERLARSGEIQNEAPRSRGILYGAQ